MRLNLKLNNNNNNNNKAFTLAEILIVLSVIAIITAILLPAARNAMPNKDLVKFKKGHMTLVHVMQELVNSDKYYADGLLYLKPNGERVDSPTYFCETFADVIGNIKTLNCKDRLHDDGSPYAAGPTVTIGSDAPYADKDSADAQCRVHALVDKDEIILADGITFYSLYPGNYIGHPLTNQFEWYRDSAGLLNLYKVYCMDIDGTPDNATASDCVNECPFGYGIRIDGKLFIGARASQWFMKTIQQKN